MRTILALLASLLLALPCLPALGEEAAMVSLPDVYKRQGLRFVPLHPPLAFGSVLVWKKHQVAFPAVSALIAHAKKCLSGILEHME